MIKWAKGESFALSKNFNVAEFTCKCKTEFCKASFISLRLIQLIQKTREVLGVSLRINSGYRCQVHNARIGGKNLSYHILGQAADLACPSNMTFDTFLTIIEEMGFDKVIPYENENFVHVAVIIL